MDVYTSVSTEFGRFLFQLWDVRTENILHEFKGHHETIGSCAFIPHAMFNGRKLVVTASSDCTVMLWDQDTSGMNCIFSSDAILTLFQSWIL